MPTRAASEQSDHPDAADRMVRLAGGRRLGYAEYGDRGGRPMLYFHGLPGSRLEARAFERAALSLGVRIVAFDRPGMGLSDFVRGRRLLDWPADVTQAADALGIDRFAVLGVSGGGPYAASCAYAIPERVTGVGIVGGLAPLDAEGSWEGLTDRQRSERAGLLKLRRLPLLTRLVATRMARQIRKPGGAQRLRESMAEVDQACLAERPELAEHLKLSVQEAFRCGGKGFAGELRTLFVMGWGFEPAEIAVPVHFWHGELDANVFVPNGRYLAAAIPECHATFLPDQGHLLFIDRAAEILAAVTT